MNKNPSMARLLSHTSMTPTERRVGRFLRAPDGHPDGNTGGDGNNGDGNSGTGGNAPANQNNTSPPEFDPASFWQDPEPDSGGSSSRSDSTPAGDSGSTPAPPPPAPAPQGDQFSQELVQRIDNLDFGPVFTDEVTAAINTGDFKAANEAITGNLRKAVKESMVTNVSLMRRFGQSLTEQLRSETQQLIESRFTGQRNTDALTQAIPSAASKDAGPGIRAIYEHALKHTKGDADKAIVMTKSMLRTLSTSAAGDIDLDVAPRDPHAPRNQVRKPTNWEEELLGYTQ